MSSQQSDLLARLHAATVEVDELRHKAAKIEAQAARLSKQQQAEMPSFTGPWTRASIEVYLERVEEWVRKPVRAQNRARLTEVGVQPKGVGEALLDDSETTDEIVRVIERITTACPFLKPFLVADNALPAWIGQGSAYTKEKLTSIEREIDGFKRLSETAAGDGHYDELLSSAVSEPNQIRLVTTKATTLKAFIGFGIVLPPSVSVASSWPSVSEVNEAIYSLTINFPEHFERIQASLQRKTLSEVNEIVGSKLQECRRTQEKLTVDWQRLHNTLGLLGEGRSDTLPPRSLIALEQQITDFLKICSDKIGKDGLALLAFLQGEEEFPTSLSTEDIHKALLSLRTFIVMSHNVGGDDA
jgi:uncharacterized coiled-coil protein SlyX